MDSSLDKPLDLKSLWRTMWRRKGIVLLCWVSVLCATTIGLSFMAPTYESQATLMIQDRQPLARELEQILGGWRSPTGGAFDRDKERMSHMIGRIRSRPFLERVIKILHLDEDPAIISQAQAELKHHPNLTEDELVIRILVSRLDSRIRFGSMGPGLYRIIISDHSGETAQLLAKWISELFVDISIQKELEQIRTAREFGAEQLRVYEEQLRLSEEALEIYKGTLISQTHAGSYVLGENLFLAENLRRTLEDEAETSKARVGPFMRAANSAGMTPGDPRFKEDPQIKARVQRITSVLETAIINQVVSDFEALSWPPKGVVDGFRRDLHRNVETLAGVFYSNATPDQKTSIATYQYARLDADIQIKIADNLRRQIAAFKRSAKLTPVDELELVGLEDMVSKNRQLLQSFRAQMVASDVSQAMETTNLGLRIEVIDPAQLPLKPSRPDKVKMFLAALLLGPLVGMGFVFLSELLDPTLRTLADIRRVAPEPIFGTIPLMEKLAPRSHGFRRHWVPAALTGVVLLTVMFWAARTTVLRDVVLASQPLHAVDPEENLTP